MTDVSIPGTENTTAFVETPEYLAMDARYVDLRDKIFAAVQKYHNDENFIPTRRLTKLKGKGLISNNYTAGGKLFGQLHEHAFGKHAHYRCTTCREAFGHMGGLVYINRSGKQFNPIAEVFAAEELQISLMVNIPRSSIESTNLELVPALNAAASVDERGDFSHFHFYTEEQIKESNLLGPIDLIAAESIVKTTKLVSAENLKALNHAIVAGRGNPDHLKGLLHFAKFVELINTVTGDENKKLWVAELLRHRDWSTIAHFNSSLAGTVLEMYLKGENLQSIIDFYLAKSDPDVFKQKQAEAKEGLLIATQKFLKDKGITGVVSRRYCVVGLDNIPYDWTAKKAAETVTDVVAKGDLVGNAFTNLIEKKANEPAAIAHNSGLADLTSNFLTRKDIENNVLLRVKNRAVDMISRDYFIKEILPKAKQLFVAMDEYSKMRWVAMFTESEATPDSGILFNPERTVALDGYGTANGLVLNEPLRMADVTRSIFGEVKYYVEAMNVFTVSGAPAITIKGGAKIAKGIFESNSFPTIVGAEMRNEHYGMAAAIVDVTTALGVQPSPEGYEEADFVTGVMLDLNTTLAAVMADGSVKVVAITTAN